MPDKAGLVSEVGLYLPLSSAQISSMGLGPVVLQSIRDARGIQSSVCENCSGMLPHPAGDSGIPQSQGPPGLRPWGSGGPKIHLIVL